MVAIRHLDVHTDDAGTPGRVGHLQLVEDRRGTAHPHAAVYRRRRMVSAVVVALLSLALLRVAAPVLGDPAVRPLEAGSVHVVQPGDTYWSIASSLDTDGDITGTVDALVAANGGRALQVGDRLTLPD